MIQQTMQIIAPVVITDSMLRSSVVPETDYADWLPGTAYTLGQRCIRPSTHRIYERRVAGTTATAPEVDVTNWINMGPTARWAMFDNCVGTKTNASGSLLVVLNPGGISGLALMELIGSSVTVSMKAATGGAVVYTRTESLDGTLIESFFDWFFIPFVQKTDLVLTDLPSQFMSCELSITLSGTGVVACGVCKFGEVIGIGGTQYGAKTGITDYSVKSTDEFGVTSFLQRSYSKKSSITVLTDKRDYNRISRALAALRAVPSVYIGTNAPGYEPLLIYGKYNDFSMDVAYSNIHYCTLEIEGLI